MKHAVLTLITTLTLIACGDDKDKVLGSGDDGALSIC